MTETLSLAQLGLSVAAGSLTTLSPCVFPILPLVVGGALQTNRLAPVAMGVGMASSFALIGLVVGALGPALGIDGDSVRWFGALLLVVFGAVMLVPQLSDRFTRLITPLASAANSASTRLDASSMLGALMLGGVLGLVWSPCSGPLLASALTMVASDGGALRGGLVLGLFGVGAAVPLVGVAYASRSGLARTRGWVMKHADVVKRGFGILILGAGLAILSGADKWLEAQVVMALPDRWIALTTLF
jgi:cytochrome c biogenesis protein CcdA